MQDAADFLRDNPNEAIARITEQGYRIYFRRMPDEFGQGALNVEIKIQDAIVGKAGFQHDIDSCHCDNIEISSDHRKRGVATALYVLAELLYREPICNFWANDKLQTGLAQAFWSQSNRPFGHRKGTCAKCG